MAAWLLGSKAAGWHGGMVAAWLLGGMEWRHGGSMAAGWHGGMVAAWLLGVHFPRRLDGFDQTLPAHICMQGVLLHTLVANMEEAAKGGAADAAKGAKGGAADAATGPSLFLYSGHDR